jgi:hypothetical protein
VGGEEDARRAEPLGHRSLLCLEGGLAILAAAADVRLSISLTLPAREASGAEVRSGERVHVAADATVDEDLVTVRGRVDGSVMGAGGKVIIDGRIGRAARLAGGEGARRRGWEMIARFAPAAAPAAHGGGAEGTRS